MKAYVHHLTHNGASNETMTVLPVARVDLSNAKREIDFIEAAEIAFEATQNFQGSWSLKLGKDANPYIDVLGDLHIGERNHETVVKGIRSSMGHDVIAIDPENGSDELIWVKAGVFSGLELLSDELIEKYQLSESASGSGLPLFEPSNLTLLSNLSSIVGIACSAHEVQEDKFYGGIEKNPIYQSFSDYLFSQRLSLSDTQINHDNLIKAVLKLSSTNYDLLQNTVRADIGSTISYFDKNFAALLTTLHSRSSNPFSVAPESRLLDKHSLESKLIESSPLLGKLYDQGSMFIDSSTATDLLSGSNNPKQGMSLS